MNISQADIKKLCCATKPAILCLTCKATVTSWHEENLIEQHGHCADCEVQAVQGVTQATNTD